MAENLDYGDGEYQELSRWAIFTLLFGLFSVTILIHPLFWVVPALTLLLGVAGYKMTQPEYGHAGRGIVLSGILLAVLFTTTAISRFAIRRAVIFSQARHHMMDWFELVKEGEIYRAHQLIKPPMMRVPQGVLLVDYYENDPGERKKAEKYFEVDPLSRIKMMGGEAKVEFVRSMYQSRRLADDHIKQLYRVHYPMEGKQHSVEIEATLIRRYDRKTTRGFWEIKAIDKRVN